MGRDKALLEWQGRPLWRVQAEKLVSLQPARTFIACRTEQQLELHPLLGKVCWLHDPPNEALGPIAAIARALGKTDLPLLVLAVDAPLITAPFLQAMLAEFETGSGGLFYRSDHGIEPLIGIYGPALRPLLLAAIERGELALQPVIQAAADRGLATVGPLPAGAQDLLVNANNPDEWAALQLQPPTA